MFKDPKRIFNYSVNQPKSDFDFIIFEYSFFSSVSIGSSDLRKQKSSQIGLRLCETENLFLRNDGFWPEFSGVFFFFVFL